jgi:hypothetical protein
VGSEARTCTSTSRVRASSRRTGEPHPLTGESMPVTLGHEFAGTVVEIGRGVEGVARVTRSRSSPSRPCPPRAPARGPARRQGIHHPRGSHPPPRRPRDPPPGHPGAPRQVPQRAGTRLHGRRARGCARTCPPAPARPDQQLDRSLEGCGWWCGRRGSRSWPPLGAGDRAHHRVDTAAGRGPGRSSATTIRHSPGSMASTAASTKTCTCPAAGVGAPVKTNRRETPGRSQGLPSAPRALGELTRWS